jgi:hypothetical protein
VKEKTSTPMLTASDDDMDLLDDDEPPLIKDGSVPPTGMDINMVFTLSAEFRGAEEEVAQMCLSSKEAVFEKLEEPSQHMKSLYVRGHIDGRLISRMLLKTNLMLNGMVGNSMEPRGIISMELTVERKSLTTAFFIVEVQGNYSIILGRDWIYVNRCVPYTLHQFLIQWIDDEIEVVYADVLAYIPLADTMTDW